jgi:hypothetical protein
LTPTRGTQKKSTVRRRTADRTPKTIFDFVDGVLVVCPDCGACATVHAPRPKRSARLVCARCGAAKSLEKTSPGILSSKDSKSWPDGIFAIGDAADPYFHRPLFLETPCAKHVLWVFNAAHLAFLKDVVAADLRLRPVRKETDPKNQLLASRLPKWMLLAKNRDAVQRAIARLEVRLGDAF